MEPPRAMGVCSVVKPLDVINLLIHDIINTDVSPCDSKGLEVGFVVHLILDLRTLGVFQSDLYISLNV